MKKMIFTLLFAFASTCFVNAAAIVAPVDPVKTAYATLSPIELTKMSTREFEKYIGRDLSKEEKQEFKLERQKARKSMKKGLFGAEGGFPWWSLVIGVLMITVTLILVL